MQFEASTRWPDEIEALRRAKAAFLLSVHKALSTRSDLYSTVVCDVDGGDEVTVEMLSGNVEAVDVLYEGFAFRLKLNVEREIILLERENVRTYSLLS
jgi:U3 small nucleolar RNA-associated protein 22